MPDTAARLAAVLARCGPARDGACDADPAARLRDGLGFDSLDVAGLACEVEQAFRVALPPGVEAGWVTVGDVLACVEQHTAKERAT
jgi:acyl carrier protein